MEDLRERFSRVFRFQQWPICCSRGSCKKRFLVAVEPHDQTQVL